MINDMRNLHLIIYINFPIDKAHPRLPERSERCTWDLAHPTDELPQRRKPGGLPGDQSVFMVGFVTVVNLLLQG